MSHCVSVLLMFTFLPRFLCRMNLLYSIFRPFGMRMANGLIGRTRPEINLRQGVVRGIEEKLPNHGSYYCFKGIPYAEPPIGDLRFEPPRPLLKFKEAVLDCSKERDVCFHADMLTLKNIGSEDCLHLNVYTPAQSDSNDALPVMVWIHGGAFKFGSGNSDYYSPEHLVQENVIVVTFNYRLSALGFLYLPEAGIYGNAALKDQRLVLEWVHDNIKHFGGNPDNVTLFGQSAGGVSAHIHSLSPNSRKYFHKLICQSGVALHEWAMERHPEEKTRKLAKLLGCQSNDPHEILAFLKGYDDLPKMIAQHFRTMSEDDWRRGFPLPFRPTVEIENPNAVITDWPMEMIENQAHSIDIPMMVGYNSIEGLAGFIDCHKNEKYQLLDKDLARFIPKTIDLASNDPKCTDFAGQIREFYFSGRNVTDQTKVELTNLLGDYHFNMDTQFLAEAYARRQHKSLLFFYQFDCDEELNLYKQILLREFDLSDEDRVQMAGACHSDEIFYLFEVKKMAIAASGEATRVRTTMCKLWTNFAKYGEPTPPNQHFEFIWSPIKRANDDSTFILDFLNIAVDRIAMLRNPHELRMSFWRKMFDEYNGGYLKAKL